MSKEAICSVIGLGNPGEKYANTRHNAGLWFLDTLAAQYHSGFRVEKKLHGMVAECQYQAQKFFLFKPNTYMNDSGRAVTAFLKFYKLSPTQILVAHDELDFAPGIVRLKKAGGHGGHNGLRDLITCLSSSDFYRLRIGIGHPGLRDDVSDYVLHKPSVDDSKKIFTSLEEAMMVVPSLLAGEMQQAFHTLHSDGLR